MLSIVAFALLPKWKLVWSDEFNKDGLLDPSKWDYETGMVRNSEAQFYTRARRENARIQNGHLIIEGRKEDYQGAKYTAASVITHGKFTFQYGRLEVSAKLPKALGTWPAIWMMGEDIDKVGWPRCAEIDVMEHVAHDPGTIYATIHQINDAHDHWSKGDKTKLADYGDRFHVYAVEWLPTGLKFFVDDKMTFEFPYKGPSTWTFDKPMYLLINLAIGGNWGGQKGIDAGAFPCQYEIDYVRVFAPTPN